MSMRKQFVDTTADLIKNDAKTVLLLGDIGVFGFRHAMSDYPDRVYNIGILEQTTISMAAGLALTGMIPIVHTIAPFIAERAYEQLKLDFGYQKINGNFISVGASYDYSKLGSTHACPGDVGALHQIPNMQIIIPGNAAEFDALYRQGYNNGKPTYYRLSEKENKTTFDDLRIGQAEVIKVGRQGTVIAVGNTLDRAVEATKDIDVTILYYTSLAPFDYKTLRETTKARNILMVEPYYQGAVCDEIVKTFDGDAIKMKFVGVPREFLTNYGTIEENDVYCGLTAENIKNTMESLIHG